jgi:hypothetical protein
MLLSLSPALTLLSLALVLACGPGSLVEDARQYALRNSFASFRSETFVCSL